MKRLISILFAVLAFTVFTGVTDAMSITVKPYAGEEVTFEGNANQDYQNTASWKYDAESTTLNIYTPNTYTDVFSTVLKSISVTGTESETLNIVINGNASIYGYGDAGTSAIVSNGPKLTIKKVGNSNTYIIGAGTNPAIKFGKGGLVIEDTNNLTIENLNNKDVSPIYGSSIGSLDVKNSKIQIVFAAKPGITMEGGKVTFTRSSIDIVGNTEYTNPYIDSIVVKANSNPFTLNKSLVELKPVQKGEYYIYGNEGTDNPYKNGLDIRIDSNYVDSIRIYDKSNNSTVLASITITDLNDNEVYEAVAGDKLKVKLYLTEGYNLKDNTYKLYYIGEEDSTHNEVKVNEDGTFTMPDASLLIDAVLYSSTISAPEELYLDNYSNYVRFSEIDYADGYELYRSTPTENDYKLLKDLQCVKDKYGDTNCTYYYDKTIKFNNKYYYKVRAYRFDESGNKVYGEFSASESKVAKISTPYINARSTNYNEITITIDDESFSDHFILERYNSSTKKWVKIKTLTKNKDNSAKYVDKSLTLGKTYKYRVRGYFKVGRKTYYSSYATDSAITKLKTPGLTATYVNETTAKVSWKKVPKATSYKIYVWDEELSKNVYLATTSKTYYNLKLDKNTEKEVHVVAVYKKYKSDHEYIVASTVKGIKPNYEVVNTHTLKLAWDKVEDAVRHEICYFSYYDGGCKEITDMNQTSLIVDNLKPGQTYYVTALTFANNGGKEVQSIGIYKTIKTIPATTTVSLAQNDYNKANINFTEVNEATGYQVYRSTNKKTWTKVATVTDALTYTDTKLTTGKKYYYKVRAYTTVEGKNYYGSFSSVKAITPKVKAPVSTTSKVAYSYVQTSWEKVPGATGYVVYRSTDGKKFKAYKTTTRTYLTDKGVTLNKTYYYKVRAYRTVSRKKYYGSFGNVTNGTPVLVTPTVTATSDLTDYSKVSWEKVAGATGYQVYVLNPETNKYTRLKSTTGLYYNHVGEVDKEYTYKVRAYRKVGKKTYYSSYSETVIGKRIPEVKEEA